MSLCNLFHLIELILHYLINKGTIDNYAVSMESQTAWITLNGKNKQEVVKLLQKSPLYKYWTMKLFEIILEL